MRLSVAANPDGNPFTPGIALKLLRDGVDSANMIGMYSMDGQPGSNNFFAHSFSNHIPFPKPGMASEALNKKFSSASDYITSLGLSDSATIDQYGNYQMNANFPWKIRFVPNPRLKEIAPAGELSSSDFTEQLMEIPAGTILFSIMALDKPVGGKD